MALPATGSTITMNQVQVRFGRASGVTVALRANLGPFVSITTGSINLSSSFGGR
jgi:hypothetical protein